jgi:site-specific DNA-methyltransferase (adenine-specific)
METKNLIDDLKAKGIHLYRDGDKLKWRAQKGMISNDLITVLKKHKQELLTMVSVSVTTPAVNDKGWKAKFADSRLQFIRGDFYPWCAANLKADSVDLILTDPPYPKKYLYLWDQLGEVAARVLKPGGILATYSGLYHLPYVLNALGKHLSYCWMICLQHAGRKQLVFASNVISTYKPIVVFKKGGSGKFQKVIADTITNDSRDKRYHKWGQGEDGVKKLMETFSDPDDLVLDPFAGGGTTLAVASALGRKCICIEIADSHFGIANSRIRDLIIQSHCR